VSAPKTVINLLPKNEFERTPWGKFFKWAVTFGKYIVIITQLVVIVAFLYRFQLDQNLDTLNESIGQQQQIITSYQDLEHRVRILQDQLSVLKTITDQQTLAGKSLEILTQTTPLEVELTALTLTKDNINLACKSLSEVGLATLVFGLQTQSGLKDITVNSVTTGGAKDPSLTFTLNAKIAKAEKEAQKSTK